MAAAFKLHQSSSQSNTRSELERYLNEDLEVCNDSFDILLYWKNNSARFPVVSKMAKDLLAIPISTVSSESAFSIGGRVLTDFRSSLSLRLVECLVCTQDWIKKRCNPIKLEDYLKEIEEMDEDLEEYLKQKQKEKEDKEKAEKEKEDKEREKKEKDKGKAKAK